MKKHNENDGGARDLDALLGKLKERHDARERSGIYASEEEFKRRFFQAARAQERPHFPMIWKAAAGIAVCLLAFQLVLTTLKDDSSAVRADNYGAPGIDMPVDGYAAAGYGAAVPEKTSDDAETEGMVLASVYNVEEGDAGMEDVLLDAGFSASMLRTALAAANDETESEGAVSMSPMAVSAFGGGFGGGAPAGGMGGFGGGAAPAAGGRMMTRMMTTDAIAMQKNAVAADAADK